MNQRERDDLDRYITGNYGEDSVGDDEPETEAPSPRATLAEGLRARANRISNGYADGEDIRTAEMLRRAAAALEAVDQKMPAGSKWSCFVLEDNCTWAQPTYRLAREMTETEFCEEVLADWPGYFLVVGVSPDEECPDEDARALPALSLGQSEVRK